jgi:hypothetical protein
MTMTTQTLRKIGAGGPARAMALAACLAGATATVAAGQPAAPVDTPWLPWLGCWQLVEETGAQPEEWEDRRSYANRVVVCLTPAANEDAGASDVTVTTIADGDQIFVETLRADGRPHAVGETTCTGDRRDTWSADGARIFTRSELACEDDTARFVTGVGLMTSASTWLDIQLVETGGRGAVTVRRYRRASESATTEAGATPLPAPLHAQARAAAHLISTTKLSPSDIVEAHDITETAVVEALMVETQSTFELDGRALLELDDASVPGDLIDLMVALSFPNRFVVDRSRSNVGSLSGGGGFASADPWGPYGRSGFQQWYPFYASPFGYYYGWSSYDSLYYSPYGSSVFLSDSGGAGRSAGVPAGRAYSGRGYTSVGAREPSPVSERRARRRGESGGTSVQSATGRGSRSGSSSSDGGGGRATSGGYSRGGSTGRTAQPREQ